MADGVVPRFGPKAKINPSALQAYHKVFRPAFDALLSRSMAMHAADTDWRRVMKIVVIGGTGLIGSKLVNRLRQRGHDVVAAAPNTGVNTITGEGLDEALTGAQ